MATLRGITVFPIKSLEGVSVEASRLTAAGALVHDRRFMLLDDRGVAINAKRHAAIHRLRAEFDFVAETVCLRMADDVRSETFLLSADNPDLTRWLSDFFGANVTLAENRQGGFPDDTDAPGPTVVSTPTLQAVADWFALPLGEVRRRFRANLEIDADAPFWEDRLIASEAQGVAFQIGDVSFLGINPCARCVVPGRSSDTGEPTPRFAQTFAQRRQATLPAWAPPDRFDHYYRLAVNTRVVPPAAGVLRLGDAVHIL